MAPPPNPKAPKTPKGQGKGVAAAISAHKIVTTLIVVVVAACVIAGCAFAGLFGQSTKSLITGIGDSNKSVQATADTVSFANGYKKSWTITADGLLSGSNEKCYNDNDACSLQVLATDADTTVIAVRWTNSPERGFHTQFVFGVDRKSGDTIWHVSNAEWPFLSESNFTSCAPSILKGKMYCTQALFDGKQSKTPNELVAIDARTGKESDKGKQLFASENLPAENPSFERPDESKETVTGVYSEIALETYDGMLFATMIDPTGFEPNDVDSESPIRRNVLISRIDPATLKAQWTSRFVQTTGQWQEGKEILSHGPGGFRFVVLNTGGWKAVKGSRIVGSVLLRITDEPGHIQTSAIDIGDGHVIFSTTKPASITQEGTIHAQASKNEVTGDPIASKYTDSAGKQWAIHSGAKQSGAALANAPECIYDGDTNGALPEYDGQAASDGKRIYAADSSGALYATDAQTCKTAWKTNLAATPSDENGNPTELGVPRLTLTGNGAGIVEYPYTGQERYAATSYELAAFNTATGRYTWTLPDSSLDAVQYADDPGKGLLVNAADFRDGITLITPTDAQVRVSDMPSSIPSCPAGWTPVSWAEWEGKTPGHTLVCSSPSSETYYLLFKAASASCKATTSSSPTSGVYAMDCGDGATVVYSLGGGLTQYSSGSKSTPVSYYSNRAWHQGTTSEFTAQPASDIPLCPAKSYPISLSTWSGQWLLTCGTTGHSITHFYYYDGTTQSTGKSMTSLAGLMCGTTESGGDATKICYSPGSVTVGDHQNDAETIDSDESASSSDGESAAETKTCSNLGSQMNPYSNDRYGFSLDHPAALIGQRPSDNGDGQVWQIDCGEVTLTAFGSNIANMASPQSKAEQLASSGIPAGSTLTYNPNSEASTSSNPNVAAVPEGRQVINSGTYANGSKSFYIYSVCGTESCVTFSYFWDKTVDSALSASDGWSSKTFNSLNPGDLSQAH